MIDYKVENGKITSIDGYEVGGGTAVEANPQEEATQQLNKVKIDDITYSTSGGNYSVRVEKIESRFSGSGGSNPAYWESNDSNKMILPNTHYDVGFTTAFCYKKKFNTKKLEPNQFIIPVGGYHALGFNQRIKQYGEVVLQVTSIEPEYNVINEPDMCYIEATYHYTYTVITAGTTGDTIQLPSYPASPYLSYEVVTLGIADA